MMAIDFQTVMFHYTSYNLEKLKLKQKLLKYLFHWKQLAQTHALLTWTEDQIQKCWLQSKQNFVDIERKDWT